MTAAVIVAAGRGTRMGPNVDKLFLEVAGRPLVAHTWMRFDRLDDIAHIVVVIRAGMQSAFEDIACSISAAKPYTLVPGGAERQDSVWNGLEALPDTAYLVAIQDGARPCTTPETIRATLAAARETGAAVAAKKITDTIKEAGPGQLITRNVDRARLWSVQTPQAFRVEVIRRALRAALDHRLTITDDTAACELIAQPVQLVETTAPNPKVTTPADLPFIELLLEQQRSHRKSQ